MGRISSLIFLKIEIIVIIMSLLSLLTGCSSSMLCLISFYYGVDFSQMFGDSWLPLCNSFSFPFLPPPFFASFN